jgi:hypothetical protein
VQVRLPRVEGRAKESALKSRERPCTRALGHATWLKTRCCRRGCAHARVQARAHKGTVSAEQDAWGGGVFIAGRLMGMGMR